VQDQQEGELLMIEEVLDEVEGVEEITSQSLAG